MEYKETKIKYLAEGGRLVLELKDGVCLESIDEISNVVKFYKKHRYLFPDRTSKLRRLYFDTKNNKQNEIITSLSNDGLNRIFIKRVRVYAFKR